MKKEEMIAILSKYALGYQGMDFSRERVSLWFELFEPKTAQEFESAMKQAVLKPGRTFFPAPGEVQEYITKSNQTEQFTPEEAWNVSQEIADGVCWHDVPKSEYAKRYQLETKPPFYLTMRTFWRTFEAKRAPKVYNPYGNPGPTIDQIADEAKYLKISFLQEYKSRLAAYRNNIELGIEPPQISQIAENQAKKYLDDLNLTIKEIR